MEIVSTDIYFRGCDRPLANIHKCQSFICVPLALTMYPHASQASLSTGVSCPLGWRLLDRHDPNGTHDVGLVNLEGMKMNVKMNERKVPHTC